MMKRCLDEGLLQAYLDGELSQERMSEAAAHVAACETCADALASAERETAFFATAFAPDDTVGVPTEALRSRINAAVAQLESTSNASRVRSRGLNFGGLLASLSGLFNFTPQTAVAFASVLVVIAFAVIYFAVHRQPVVKPSSDDQSEIAKNVKPSPRATQEVVNQPTGTGDLKGIAPQPSNGTVTTPVSGSRFVRSRGFHVKRPINHPKAPELLPGEKEYQTAIASLEKTIKMGGDATLRPAVRVEYERNLAILDSAISQTRQVAARNPKDRDAVGFLMSAYQSKVELLTKVADQAQVAALGR